MAPEMIQNGTHNHTLDVWCLGILLYELIHGHAPFTGQSIKEISEKIMKRKIMFRKDISPELKDLILSILRIDANERIPLVKVFIHPWVKSFEKKYGLNQTLSPKKQRPQTAASENKQQYFPAKPKQNDAVMSISSSKKFSGNKTSVSFK